MRPFVVVLALLATCRLAVAEVVITNLGQSSLVGTTFGNADWVQFNSSLTGALNTLVVKLRAATSGQSVNSVSATITASAAASGGSVTRSAVLSQVPATNFFEATFDLTGLSHGSGTNKLTFTDINSVTSDSSALVWGATNAANGGFTYASGYSNAGTSDDGVSAYGQFAVSVPEPGTWMLGAVCVVAGLVLCRGRLARRPAISRA
ncbi:MAG: hypothetical protein LW700_11720 [Gemmataceae bacterium]|nr:hypothetical protein [Gemmataceae bacterium]